MPALNFKARFADPVERHEKRQTIRARGKRRPPKVGETLHLYTGLRTSWTRKLREVVCVSVESISIGAASRTVSMPCHQGREPVWRNLNDAEVMELARADGFDGPDDFFAFFAEEHGRTFFGYLIKW